MPSATPSSRDSKEPDRRSVQPTELIGAALSTNLAYQRLIKVRLRRELIYTGPQGLQSLLRATMKQLGGSLTERSKTLRQLLDDDPALMALLPGAARPPMFNSRDGWRRQEQRLTVRCSIVCTIERHDLQVSCHVLDISRRGAFAGCSRKDLQYIVAETNVMIRSVNHQTRLFGALERHGAVRWTGFSVNHQERGFGIEFCDTVAIVDDCVTRSP